MQTFSPNPVTSADGLAEPLLLAAMRPYVLYGCGHADAVLTPIGSFALQLSWPTHADTVDRREHYGIATRRWSRPLVLHFGLAELAALSDAGDARVRLGEQVEQMLEDFMREGHDLTDGSLEPLTLRVDHQTLSQGSP